MESFLKSSAVAKEFLNLALTCNCCYTDSEFGQALLPLDVIPGSFTGLTLFFGNENDSFSFEKHFSKSTFKQLSNQFFIPLKNGKFPKEKSGTCCGHVNHFAGQWKAYSGFWGDAVMSLLLLPAMRGCPTGIQ